MKRNILIVTLIVLAWVSFMTLWEMDETKQWGSRIYEVPENIYLSNLSAKLSEKTRIDPRDIEEWIRENNEIDEYLLTKGEKIIIPRFSK